MHILKASEASVQQVLSLLASGAVVALPTETVYGLAADGTNSAAVAKIFEIKGRPPTNPLILHTHSIESASRCANFTPLAVQLAEKFWPGPLTLVLSKTEWIPEIVTAGLHTVGIRIPDQPWMLKILEGFNRPLAAPSANPSNYLSPTTAQHVEAMFRSQPGYIFDGGACYRGVESTIIDLSIPDQPTLLRPGPLLKKEIESAIGGSLIDRSGLKHDEKVPLRNPGAMAKHYSPHTPLWLTDTDHCIATHQDAVLHFCKTTKKAPDSGSTSGQHFYLS